MKILGAFISLLLIAVLAFAQGGVIGPKGAIGPGGVTFVAAASSNPPISLDTVLAATAVGSGTTVSLTYVNAGNFLFVGTIGDRTPTGCTYNSVGMTQMWTPKLDGGLTFYGTGFGLVAPASGSHTITCTFNSGMETGWFVAASWKNVDQTTPYRTPATNTDGGTCPAGATTIANANGQNTDLVVDFLESDTTGAITLTTNQTQVFNTSHPDSSAFNSGIATAAVSAAANTAMTWSQTGTSVFCWTHAAFALVQANGASGLPSFVQSESVASNSLAYASNVTSGNALIAAAWCGVSATCTVAFTSTHETWPTATATGLATDGDTIAVACIAAAGTQSDTVSATGNGVAGNVTKLVIMELAHTSCTLDTTTSPSGGTQTADGSFTTPVTTGNITSTTDGDAAITVFGTA